MSDPFLGEIRPFAGNYQPEGWIYCDGRLLTIVGNQALYAILGTTYGGNGTTNFAIPDLRGRLPVGMGQGTGLTDRVVGQMGGTSTVQLVEANLPSHSHTFSISGNAGTTNTPAAGSVLSVPGAQPNGTIVSYADPTNPAAAAQTFDTGSVTVATGNSQPHNNLMPYLALNYIMAITGIFPNRQN